MGDRSVVEYFGEYKGYSCGYCKCSDTCCSHGMWGHGLTPQDYQDLINRGWRRSGKYCYKPTMRLTCCPQYTIRCEALKFKPSKSQKKILKRVKNYLIHGQTKSDERDEHLSSCDDRSDQPMEYAHIPKMNLSKKDETKKDVDSFFSQSENYVTECDLTEKEPSSMNITSDIEPPTNSSAESCMPEGTTKSGKGPDPNRPRCRKAKELRRERKMQKLLKSGVSAEEISKIQTKQKCEEKTVEDFISEANVENPCHRLELRLIPSNLNHPQFSKTFEQSYSLYQKYQTIIHKDPPEKCSKKQYTRFLVNNPFQLRLVKLDSKDKEYSDTYKESVQLYKKYQMTIHNETEEECDQYTYNSFLGETPIKFSDDSPDSPDFYGSYHQQYWLDNKLIAVGVVDILPYCMSSVYLYYDPDYGFLSLGTYAALREVAFVRELQKTHRDLKYYYMGFYIHSCPKMKYKGSYSPSFLLCPETYIFKPIENCIPKLNVSKYSRLEENPEVEDADGVVHLKEVMVLYQRQVMCYARYRTLNVNAGDEELVRQYANLIGKKCYRRMLLYRSI